MFFFMQQYAIRFFHFTSFEEHAIISSRLPGLGAEYYTNPKPKDYNRFTMVQNLGTVRLPWH